MVRCPRRSSRDPLKLRCSVLSFAYFGVVCFAMPHKLQRDNLFKLFAGMISYVSFLALLVLKYVGDPELAPPGVGRIVIVGFFAVVVVAVTIVGHCLWQIMPRLAAVVKRWCSRDKIEKQSVTNMFMLLVRLKLRFLWQVTAGHSTFLLCLALVME